MTRSVYCMHASDHLIAMHNAQRMPELDQAAICMHGILQHCMKSSSSLHSERHGAES